jgi:hypothetical protein
MDVNSRKKLWKDHFDNIMNVENEWIPTVLEKVEGPLAEFTQVKVRTAIDKIQGFKAAGPNGVNAAMIRAAREKCVRMLTAMANDLLFNHVLPEELKHSTVVALYKGKGDRLSCNSFRGIKLLEHSFKILEKLLETRLRHIVQVEDTQFGFMPGRGTIDAIFLQGSYVRSSWQKARTCTGYSLT